MWGVPGVQGLGIRVEGFPEFGVPFWGPNAKGFACLSYSLNSLKGVIHGIVKGSIVAVTRGDTRSLDYSLLGVWCLWLTV